MRIATLLLPTMLLAACGGSQADRAVAACAAAVEKKLEGRSFRIDRDEMARNAVPDGTDVIHVQASIVFDPDLPREYTQSFDCRARVAGDGAAPDVISLTFTW